MRLNSFAISDVEFPQMGTKQWKDTYRSQLTADVSPTIIDMIGSVRSKIFSILKIIERNGEKHKIAREHYKILLDELPTRDRVRLIISDQTDEDFFMLTKIINDTFTLIINRKCLKTNICFSARILYTKT